MTKMLLALGATVLITGCTTVERNQVAASLCARTAGCTVSDQREAQGPLQVVLITERRKPKTTEH